MSMYRKIDEQPLRHIKKNNKVLYRVIPICAFQSTRLHSILCCDILGNEEGEIIYYW